MRQKLPIIFFVLLSLFLALPRSLQADQKTAPLTLSDAVYADIAIRHYLQNVSISSIGNKPQDQISINALKQWLPASTIKLYVAMYAYDQINKNNIGLSDNFFVEGKNVVPTEMETPELPYLYEGEYVTTETLIRQMITQSDNTAYNVLLDVLNRKNITEYIRSIGLAHSAIGSKLNLDDSQQKFEFSEDGYGINTTTSEDYAKAFDLIRKNKIARSRDLFEVLKEQKINNMLPLFLPKTVTVAHKTGDLDPEFHDGGIIVDPKRSYVLTVFSNLGDPTFIVHLAERIYSRDYNLVGSKIKSLPISKSDTVEIALDPIMLKRQDDTTAVLGDQTPPVTPPTITASDLGIKANDLSQSIPDNKLPKVLIPADSPFHFLISSFKFARKTIAIDSSVRSKAELENLKLSIAEAKDLQKKGKPQEATKIFSSVQASLQTVAQNKAIQEDGDVQTAIQSVSETRFEALGIQLQHANSNQKTAIIQEIANEAKSTSTKIIPYIQKAENSTNPSQKPLIGEVVKVENDTAIVKTSGGQEITVPNIQKINIQSRNTSQEKIQNSSQIKVGATIAVIGTANDKIFVPTTIVTNIPKELAAPKAVTVIKVDPEKKTMIISENGIPVQVNISTKTRIQGKDTAVSLKAIHPGDIVSVSGESVKPTTNPSIVPNQTLSPTAAQSATPAPIKSDSISPSSKKPLNSSGQSLLTPTQLPITTPSSSKPGNSPIPSQKAQSPVIPTYVDTVDKSQKSSPQVQQKPVAAPQVIQSTTIKVVEKKEDVSKPNPAPQPQVTKPSQQQSSQSTKAPEEPKKTSSDNKPKEVKK